MTDQRMYGGIVERILAVMIDVGAIGKHERNKEQGFSFRGIDTIINAVQPALIRHQLIVVPRVEYRERTQVPTSSGKMMNYTVVQVEYTFHDIDGNTLSCSSIGAAFDSGDKSEAKAMSVAFRVALLQALSLPTDDPDPDSESHQMTKTLPDTEGAKEWYDKMKAAVDAVDADAFAAVCELMTEEGVREHIYKGVTLSELANLANTKLNEKLSATA